MSPVIQHIFLRLLLLCLTPFFQPLLSLPLEERTISVTMTWNPSCIKGSCKPHALDLVFGLHHVDPPYYQYILGIKTSQPNLHAHIKCPPIKHTHYHLSEVHSTALSEILKFRLCPEDPGKKNLHRERGAISVTMTKKYHHTARPFNTKRPDSGHSVSSSDTSHTYLTMV